MVEVGNQTRFPLHWVFDGYSVYLVRKTPPTRNSPIAMKYRHLALGILLIACLSGCELFDGADDTPLEGLWGGDGIRLVVAGSGGTVRYSCAEGRLGKLTVPDKDGRFDAEGWYALTTLEFGYERLPARHEGQVTGATMTLTVTLLHTDEEIVSGQFTLVRGEEGRFSPCL